MQHCERQLRSSEHPAHHRVAWVWQAAWASIVLIVYCTSDPRGRPLLREHTSLTDLDVHTACTLEAYGRGEVTRRARLRAQHEAEEAKKQAAKRPRKADAEASAPPVPPKKAEIDEVYGVPIEDDAASIVNDDDEHDDDPLSTETADQKVLATKRKRASKGYASASTADAFGILTW